MATKTNWQPGSTVCRCCFAEGCYKDISTEYFWMGKREVYSEMLLDTFDVSISYALSGPNSNSRLICEPCISRLRDATDFKRQVQECERTFMTHLNPVAVASTSVEALPESEKEELKLEQIKVEIKLDEPNYDDDDHAFQDDDDDDMDDQPLTALASKVPKKETMDLSDLLDNAKPEKLKRKIATKAKASPAKKAKKEVKPSASKAKEDDKKKKDLNTSKITRRNAATILRYTNVCPFRLQSKTLLCLFCSETFTDENPFEMRRHFEEMHQEYNTKHAFFYAKETILKVDCSDLICKLCNDQFQCLEDVAIHLQTGHNIDSLNLDYEIALQPYRFDDQWGCCICNYRAMCLLTLSRHMHQHYKKFQCDSCGKSYASISGLTTHNKYHHTGKQFPCRKCWKEFPSAQARLEHILANDACKPVLCSTCGVRFMSLQAKVIHNRDVHGIIEKSYDCKECDAQFESQRLLFSHHRLNHTNEYSQCEYCEMKFVRFKEYEDHVTVHTKERKYQCSECDKTFVKQKSLRIHFEAVHCGQKRFLCGVCEKQFSQRNRLMKHLAVDHPFIEFEAPA